MFSSAQRNTFGWHFAARLLPARTGNLPVAG